MIQCYDFFFRYFRAILHAGAHVEARDFRGSTPFLVCCSTGRLDVATLLREAGADITVKNSQGQDAHAIAVFFNKQDMAVHFGPDTPSKRYT